MLFTPIKNLDRFRGVLAAQLLSSQTTGTFQINTASALGAQLVTMAAGYYAKVTIEDEHILLSGFSVSGATVTCTIATNGRGYNGTTAATHAADTTVEIRYNKADVDNINAHLLRFDDGGIINALGTVIPTITDGNTHVIAGDYTTILTVGRSYFFKVSSTWYRAIIRSAVFATGNTTFEITGDGLVTSGTILATGLGFDGNVYAPVNYQLVKEATNDPADNPPAGYQWLFVQAAGWHTKDSSGNIRFLCGVQAAVSSAAGVVALDWSVANVYDTTLTENVTTVTHTNGVQGQTYKWRIKQHASSPKTVVLAGKTRFSNTIASYTMTTDVSAFDILEFLYNSTDDKYDLTNSRLGFQTSPTQTASAFTVSGTAGETITAGQAVYLKNSDTRYWLADADGDESTFSFAGIAASSSTAGNPISVWPPGAVATGLSGLTAGSYYFISATAGGLATAPGARIARIGHALSTTTMRVIEPKFVRYLSATGDRDTVNQTLTVGFYPAVIRCIGYQSAAAGGMSVGDDGVGSVNVQDGGGGAQYSSAMGNVRTNSGGNISVSLVSKSRTQFVIDWGGNDTADATFYFTCESL